MNTHKLLHSAVFVIVVAALLFSPVERALSSTGTVILFDDFLPPSLDTGTWSIFNTGGGSHTIIPDDLLEINSGTNSGGGYVVFSSNTYTQLLFDGSADMLVLEMRVKVGQNPPGDPQGDAGF